MALSFPAKIFCQYWSNSWVSGSVLTWFIVSRLELVNLPYLLLLLRLAPLQVHSATGCQQLQSGWFWARSTVSVHDSPWESRSFCTVFIQVICGRPGGLFQYTEGKEVKFCFASTLSSIWVICPNRVRRRAWIISVSRGWMVWHRTSSLEMKWYHLVPRSICTSEFLLFFRAGNEW